MIGQTKLKAQLAELKIQPNLIMIVGDKGSGKKTLCRECFSGEKTIWLETVQIDAVRYVVDTSYKLRDCIFVMCDVDTMSANAKSVLLKVVEECPNNNKYVMTVSNIDEVYNTIRSRACVFYMDAYSRDEIYKYTKSYYNDTLHDDEWEIVSSICDTIGDVNTMGKHPLEFYNYVELVVDNIAEVSGANVFKIADKLALKGESDKYDVKLFLKAFRKVCIDRLKTDGDNMYADAVKVTTKYLGELRITGVNKQMLIDAWMLDIREVWLYEGK